MAGEAVSGTQAILAISSEVVCGHVGNGAVRPALERLGFEVWSIPTVLLSHHPGHGAPAGEVMSADLIARVVGSLAAKGWLAQCGAIYSGYLAEAAQAPAIAAAVDAVRRQNPQALYICDPIIGDWPNGQYVKEGVPEAILTHLLPRADMATPNAFELGVLAGKDEPSLSDLRALGPSELLCTSIRSRDQSLITQRLILPDAEWQTNVDYRDGAPNGTGDLLAALYIGWRLRDCAPREALIRAVGAVDHLVDCATTESLSELPLIREAHRLADPPHRPLAQLLPK